MVKTLGSEPIMQTEKRGIIEGEYRPKKGGRERRCRK
jgi:hypothetical protein